MGDKWRMLAGMGGTGLERRDRSDSASASLRSMDNASIAIASRSSRTTNASTIPDATPPPSPSDKRDFFPGTNNKRKRRTTGGGGGSTKTPLELSEGFVRYLPIKDTNEVIRAGDAEDQDFLYSSCSELEDYSSEEEEEEEEGEGEGEYRGSTIDEIRKKKAEALRRDVGEEEGKWESPVYSLDDRLDMSPDRATPLKYDGEKRCPSSVVEDTTARSGRMTRGKSQSLGTTRRRNRRRRVSSRSPSYMTCFGCWYDGVAEEEGELEPTNMTTLIKIFWENYGNVDNAVLARMCHTFFKDQIYRPMREAGHQIGIWRTWQIKLHFEKHVLDPRIHIGQTLKKYKNLASVLENRCVKEVEVGAGESSSSPERPGASDLDVDPLGSDTDGKPGSSSSGRRRKTVQILDLDTIKLMLDVDKRILDLYGKKTDLMNFNSKECTIDSNSLGRLINPNKRWKFAADG